MKTAICYRGHYYREKPHGSNFFLNLENNQNMLLNRFSDFDVFFHTYSVNSEMNEKLKTCLNPTDYIIENTKSSEIRHSTLKVNELVTSDYDFIINLRFDLHFKVPFTDLNIEHEKFNFLWRERRPMWKRKGATSDFLFAFHSDFKSNFDYAYGDLYDKMLGKNNPARDGLLIYNTLSDIVDETDINFLINNYVESGKADRHNNKYITLNRNIK